MMTSLSVHVFGADVGEDVQFNDKKRERSFSSVSHIKKLQEPPTQIGRSEDRRRLPEESIQAGVRGFSSSQKLLGSKQERITLYGKFHKVMSNGRYSITPLVAIKAEDEDREGSRKWVKSFEMQKEIPKSHSWYRKTSRAVERLRSINNEKKYLPVQVNFAAARLTFMVDGQEPEEVEVPFFFISGWPASDLRDGGTIETFSKLLSEERLGEALKPYKHYGLKFITMSYVGGERQQMSDRRYGSHKVRIQEVMDKELEMPLPIVGTTRIKSHLNIVVHDDANDILSQLYFHSEQAIWMYVKEEIGKFTRVLMEKARGNESSTPIIKHALLDICSFYDMCWCCGDTLAGCCHTLTLDIPVYVRSLGCKSYVDRPFLNPEDPYYSLRKDRHLFAGYERGEAFKLPSSVVSDPAHIYQPYVAHAANEDI